MPTLMMLKGLPGSGKSTFAKSLASEGWLRINKDDLRQMLFDGKWTPQREKAVLAARDSLIVAYLQSGRNVVVDDTNLVNSHARRLGQLAKENGAEFVTNDSFLSVPLDECLARNRERPSGVPEAVIRKMWRDHVRPEPPSHDTSLPRCVIVDIDGTLAHMNGRGPFEWHRVGEDLLDTRVAEVVDFYAYDCKIILLSGREDVCRAETVEWLANHHVEYDELHMRAAGDSRKDSVVKREMFDKHIQGRFFPYLVIDDRDSVVRMWRDDLGLTTWQVAWGDF